MEIVHSTIPCKSFISNSLYGLRCKCGRVHDAENGKIVDCPCGITWKVEIQNDVRGNVIVLDFVEVNPAPERDCYGRLKPRSE